MQRAGPLSESGDRRQLAARPAAVTAGVLRVLAVVTVAVLGLTWFTVHRFVTTAPDMPSVPPVDVVAAVTDTRPVAVQTTIAWTKVPETVTVHRLLTDHTLWRRMHFDDWDHIPEPLRERALRAMTRAYARVFAGPHVWRKMDADDWDVVPQPLRAIAYLRMVWYWAQTEEVGVDFGLEPRRMAQTIAAIVMQESWFEHRAVNENRFGNRDLGLSQCSDPCRRTIAEMAAAGEIDFAPAEADYFNPWIGTRVATVWFARELRLAGGDVDAAIRAYHRGFDNAFDAIGDLYLSAVHRRRDRYVLNQGGSATWRFLVQSLARVDASTLPISQPRRRGGIHPGATTVCTGVAGISRRNGAAGGHAKRQPSHRMSTDASPQAFA